jgi:hypothetical protein
MKFEIEISDAAFELLKKIHNIGYAEYRDPEYSSIEEFKKSEDYKKSDRSVEWFKHRNFDGTLYLIYELCRYNLVENDFDAWNKTFKISGLGEELLGQKEEFLLTSKNEKIKLGEDYFTVDQNGVVEKKTLLSIIRPDNSFRYFKDLESSNKFIEENTLTTEDGEKYFYGIWVQNKKIYCVNNEFKGVDVHDGYYPGMGEYYLKFFGSRERAEEFLIRKNPCLCFDDIIPFVSNRVEEETIISIIKEKIQNGK